MPTEKLSTEVEIRVNQTVQITNATPFLIFGNLFALLAILSAVEAKIFTSYAFVPMTAMLLLLLPMVLSYRKLHNAPRPAQASKRRIRSIEIHSLLLGLCWAATLVMLFPNLEAEEHVWVVTSTFFLAFGSAPSVSSIPRAAAAFSLPMFFTSWIFSHTAGEFHAVQVIAYHFGAIAAFGKVLRDNWLLFRHNVVLSMEHTKALSDHLLVEQEQRRQEAGEAARERALQLEVAEKEALLRTALDSMESGLLMYSADLEVELVNDRLLEFLDIPPEFMQIGKSAVPAMEYFAARGDFGEGRVEDIVAWRQKELRAITDGYHEVRHRPERITETYWSRTRTGSIVSVTADITARVQAEQELKTAKDKAEKLAQSRADLVATVSHEVRTPMNGVLGMAQLMGDMELSPELRECVDVIVSSGGALLRIVDDLLDIAKLDAEGLELEKVPFRVTEVVKESVGLMQNRADEKGIELVATLAPEVPEVVIGDPLRLRQVILNLVSNAIKFTEEGSVMIAAAPRGTSDDGVKIEFGVIDTGKGIDQKAQAKLFSPYTQESVEVARKYGGTGLGLAICRRLVRLMDGEISVESEIGQGSVFRFAATYGVGTAADLAKIGEDAKDQGSRATTLFRSARPLLVLQVEDNLVNRQVVERMLTRAGHVVVNAFDGKDALDAILSQDFDIVLMDRHMPNMSGLEATREIRKLAGSVAEIPILGITASAVESELEACLNAGMTEVITKPVNQRILVNALERLTGGLIETAKPWLGKIVLVADDIEINRTLAQKQLEKLGIECVFAEDGEQALALTTKHQFDAALIDNNMPKKNGIEYVHELRALEPSLGYRTLVIAMTGTVGAGTREQFLAAGMDDYLAKPVDIEQLSITLGRWLSDPSKPQENEVPVTVAETVSETLQVLDLTPMREAHGKIDKGALEMLEMYRKTAVGLLAELETAMAELNWEAAKTAAHSLAGASKYAGAQDVGAILSAIEVALRDNDEATATLQHSELSGAWDRLEMALAAVEED